MKTVIAFLAILALSSAQLPVPIPPVSNISSLGGKWYIAWTYSSSTYNPVAYELSCFEWDISVNSDGGEIRALFSTNNNPGRYTIEISDIGTPNTVWDESMNWIALDPVHQAWATIGATPSQDNKEITSGYILSRTKNLSSAIIRANVALLVSEQFAVNNTNQYLATNKGCP